MFRTRTSSRAVALAILGGVFAAGLAASAMAESKWAKDHPRRHEVNERLANQDRRIHNEVKEGKMSKAQAKKLHHEDHQIRQEERDMASQNGGHITKQEQHVLNQQENAVSKQIGR
jgi:CRISPR/Cas system Type II protein with McrA/HNH and RuvC-like nuclease domain